MINLHTKFEVSMFTDYEDIKGNLKCRYWTSLGVTGHPRSLVSVSSFDRAHVTGPLGGLVLLHQPHCTVVYEL